MTPRILVAPHFTQQLSKTESNTEKPKNPVISALIPIAEKLRAIIVADGPNTNDEEAVKYRKSIGSSRVYAVDPWVKVFIDSKEEILPTSPFVAGLIAKVNNELGFYLQIKR